MYFCADFIQNIQHMPYRLFFYFSLVVFLFLACNSGPKYNKAEAVIEPEPNIAYGYNLDNFQVINDTIQVNETLGQILNRYHLTPAKIYEISNQVKDSFDIRKIKAGKSYTILTSKDSLEKAQVFIYKPNEIDYQVLDFSDSITQVKKESKPVNRKVQKVAGVINSSLFMALNEQGLNDLLALKLSDIYAWTVDFYHVYKGDKFKIIYDELFIDDSVSVGIGKIHAAYFEHHGKPLYAFNYVVDSTEAFSEYFDEESRNLRKAFLKSPIKFGRISSRYNMHRYLKMYGRVKPHLGTDFAAPVGTPIMSTANGVVVKSTYARGNGNYVKIKHNATYSTQYLHMQKRAVKVGDVVKQGQVIGYIGMTGFTNGPHVCYRFWKNGKQVDALKQELPAAKPMHDSIKPYYFEYIKPIKRELDSIPYPVIEKIKEPNVGKPQISS